MWFLIEERYNGFKLSLWKTYKNIFSLKIKNISISTLSKALIE